MAVLRTEGLEKGFGERVLFSGVSLELFEKDHAALIGNNGCGKTTLLRILAGEEGYDGGTVNLTRGRKCVLLDQSPSWPEGMTLMGSVLTAFQHLSEIEDRLAELHESMIAGGSVSESDLRRQAELRERFEEEGGLTYRSRTRAALLGLGFSEAELDQEIATMSGGQMRKAELARILLSDADLLLLDEPTNHLDITAMEWLESYLTEYRKAFLVVSHDRYFLDRVATKVLELANGTIHAGTGNYTSYMEKKLSEREYALRHYRNGLREIKRIEGIIEQQRRWNQERNYVTIASKQKQIERLKAALIRPEEDPETLRFSMKADDLTCDEVIRCDHLSMGFPGKGLFSDLNLLVHNGEKVCLIGENGCGKTTLMRILLGQENPTGGSCRLGPGVRPGYFAQSTVRTTGSWSVLEEMNRTYPRLDNREMRTYLGRFLFHGDDVFKPMEALSGGEAARVQLLKLMLSGSNVLFLDETTNHLDITSCEALENALCDYGGTMLIITHDRYLANRIADRIVLMGKNGLEEFEGDGDSLKTVLEERRQAEAEPEPEAGPKNDYQRLKAARAGLAKARADLRRAEERIGMLEEQIAERERMLSEEEGQDYTRTGELYLELTRLQEQLDEAYREWETCTGEVERMEEQGRQDEHH
jgi:ATP-binding cassette subfamily F protein 3